MTKKTEPRKISELIGELEEKVERLRDGEDDLEESIRLYKEGMALAKQCEKRLEDARLEIEKIGVPASVSPDDADDGDERDEDLPL